MCPERSLVGGECWLQTRLAALAYRKKSYHSMVVPTSWPQRAVRRSSTDPSVAQPA